ncbi:MAG: M15 family metallopeptidase [Erysipelotrichaceae bacterium]|nr:M15 family metallopeptidase [Erysipelotrichaceae bacterium]
MKKVVVLLLCFILLGCTKNYYKELGYDSKTVKKIESLKDNNQVFFSEYNENLTNIINNEDFIEDNLKTYVLFVDLLDCDTVIRLVNNKTLGEFNLNRINEIINDQNYDENHLEEYLKYYPRTSESLLIKLINNDRMDEYPLIAKLASDKGFVEDNVDIYLKHIEEKETIRELIEYINSKAYLPPYENEEKADTDKYGYLVLVNKYYKLAEDYKPDDLVEVESNYGRGFLRKEAYEAYKKMQDDAEKEGLSMYITSPYRSYDTQYKLYNYYLSIDPQDIVDTYSARPGNSEHQLGLAVDILSPGYDFGNFYQTKEAEWLKENAYKYGFIFRYPEDKVDITGYKFEPWHYRYVGKIAKDIYDSGLTYDEYFEKYIK